MDSEPKMSDRTIIIIGNIGKYTYRVFIVIMLNNIYAHLMGEKTTLGVMTLLILFPITWITMKEMLQDLDNHDKNKVK